MIQVTPELKESIVFLTGVGSFVGSIVGLVLSGYYSWRGKPVKVDDQGGETFSIILFMISFLILILILSTQSEWFKMSLDKKYGLPLYLGAATIAALSLWGTIEAVKGDIVPKEVTESGLQVKVDTINRRLVGIPWIFYYFVFIAAVYVIMMEYLNGSKQAEARSR